MIPSYLSQCHFAGYAEQDKLYGAKCKHSCNLWFIFSSFPLVAAYGHRKALPQEDRAKCSRGEGCGRQLLRKRRSLYVR